MRVTSDDRVRQWLSEQGTALRRWDGGLWSPDRPPENWTKGMTPTRSVGTATVKRLWDANVIEPITPGRPFALLAFVLVKASS